MESAVNTILRDADILSEIQRMATTVKNNGEKIVKKAEKLRTTFEDQTERIQNLLATATTPA